jgi:DNA-binding response OmpR family regulator
LHILIIEDEQKLADMLKRGLEEYEYSVAVAYDGLKGWELASSKLYDLLILDIMLPGLDGITLCQRLRQAGSDMGILMLTAKDALADRVTGLDAGADDYLMKPFAFRELLARINAITRRGGKYPNSFLEAGELKLDLVSHQAIRLGKTISLSAKEFALLELLMRHPGQMLRRELIAEQIWHERVAHDSNIVDVYISFLRRKIDSGFQPKLIQTVQKAGYRLSVPDQSERGNG